VRRHAGRDRWSRPDRGLAGPHRGARRPAGHRPRAERGRRRHDGRGGAGVHRPATGRRAGRRRAVQRRRPDLPGGAAFDGTVAEGAASIAGDYTQAGQTFPFRLERGPLSPPARPQDPQPPLPYRAEDVSYPSGDLTLAGTLTLPEGPGPFAAVVLITGSGPQDRDADQNITAGAVTDQESVLEAHLPELLRLEAWATRG
jgi:hypothetical protein